MYPEQELVNIDLLDWLSRIAFRFFGLSEPDVYAKKDKQKYGPKKNRTDQQGGDYRIKNHAPGFPSG